MAEATVDQLHAALIELAAFLEARSLPFAGEVQRRADEVGRGDAHGAERFLDLDRAMLDVRFSPVNGNATDDAEAQELQQRFEALHARASSLAARLT